MGWKPLNEVYFVRPEEIKTSRLVPEHLKENMTELRTGIVTHVGTGTLLENGSRAQLQATTGDRVIYGIKAGQKIDVEGEKLTLLAEANILAVWKENDSPNCQAFRNDLAEDVVDPGRIIGDR